jgi:hypothetical protein
MFGKQIVNPATLTESIFATGLNGDLDDITLGEPVYVSQLGLYRKGINSIGPRAYIHGLCCTTTGPTLSTTIQVSGIITLTTATWDALTGESGGLSVGILYYLGSIYGTLTSTCPTSGYVTELGTAVDVDKFLISIKRPILL